LNLIDSFQGASNTAIELDDARCSNIKPSGTKHVRGRKRKEFSGNSDML